VIVPETRSVLESAGTSLQGLPTFLAYFGLAIGLMLVYLYLYTLLTPQHEFVLIRLNNHAAATALGGSLIGFALPLHAAITNAIGLIDCALWGLVALAIQVLTFLVLRLVLSGLPDRIARGEQAAASLVASVSIAVGLLNAAAMTYY
jgi:putative membrane protein